MARLIQRKKFDRPEVAHEVANNFEVIDAGVPGRIRVSANEREIDGEHWVYLTSEGDLAEGDEMRFPDYEVVETLSS